MKTLITVSHQPMLDKVSSPEAFEKLASFSDITVIPPGLPYSNDDLARDIADYDAVFTTWGSPKVTAEALANAKKLKFVGHMAGSVIPYVDPIIFDTDITVCNANYPLARATAEGAFAMMFYGARDMGTLAVRLKNGGWFDNSSETVTGVYGTDIGLIGYGEISREVVSMLKPFDCNIRMYSRHLTDSQASDMGIQRASLEDVLTKSDIISLHSTYTPSTEKMIGKSEFAMMRDNTVFVNTARGPIIDEDALIAELQSGRLRACLDVFCQEPLPTSSELLKLDNVLCLPHTAGTNKYWNNTLMQSIVDDFECVLEGREPRGLIDLDRFNRLTPR